MAGSSASTNDAAQSTVVTVVPDGATAGDNALPKSPPGEAEAAGAQESTSADSAPPLIAPKANEALGTSAAPANGIAGVGNTILGSSGVSGVSGVSRVSGAVADTMAKTVAPGEKQAEATAAAAKNGVASPREPPVMTGALFDAEPKPSESSQDDGVKDITVASAPTTTKPVEVNGVHSKDVAVEDTHPAAPEKLAINTISEAQPASASDATSSLAETDKKRKADTDNSNGASAAKEPAAKKQKPNAAEDVEKAHQVTEEFKEKAEGVTTKSNSLVRRASKKVNKKAPAPVGRTERKTRSQGRAD